MSKAEQNRQTQSGTKHRKKSYDLRRPLKAVSDVDEVTLDGRADCSILVKPRPEMHDHQRWSGASVSVMKGKQA